MAMADAVSPTPPSSEPSAQAKSSQEEHTESMGASAASRPSTSKAAKFAISRRVVSGVAFLQSSSDRIYADKLSSRPSVRSCPRSSVRQQTLGLRREGVAARLPQSAEAAGGRREKHQAPLGGCWGKASAAACVRGLHGPRHTFLEHRSAISGAGGLRRRGIIFGRLASSNVSLTSSSSNVD